MVGGIEEMGHVGGTGMKYVSCLSAIDEWTRNRMTQRPDKHGAKYVGKGSLLSNSRTNNQIYKEHRERPYKQHLSCHQMWSAN